MYYLIQYTELLSVLITKFTKLFESYNAIFNTIHFYIYHTQKKHNFEVVRTLSHKQDWYVDH